MTTTSPTDRTGAVWYLRTAGVGPNDGLRWMSLNGSPPRGEPERIVHGEVGGSALLDLLSESDPTIVLGPTPDGTFVLFASGLTHPGAPAEGDYQGRPIEISLLGAVALGADPSPLLAAAIALLKSEDDFAASLPLRWTDLVPEVETGAGWKPPRPDRATGEARVNESFGYPRSGGAELLVRDLSVLSPGQLGAFPTDRLVLLASDFVPLEDVAAARPWRVLSGKLASRREFKEDKRSLTIGPGLPQRLMALASALALVALLTWLVARWVGSASG